MVTVYGFVSQLVQLCCSLDKFLLIVLLIAVFESVCLDESKQIKIKFKLFPIAISYFISMQCVQPLLRITQV